MADIEPSTTNDSTHHVWNFLWLGYQRVGFWCRCTWFGFLGPGNFDRTTNQEQLCGFWIHVSLLGFFPSKSSWSLLRCPQTHTTKLLDAKTGRLREHNQYYSARWSSLEIFWLLSMITGRTILSVVWVMFPKTETIKSHNSRAGSPSNLNPASKEMISDSVELCETEVCFLHIQLIGTNVWLPKMHNVPPEVDFESSRSSAKSESWNSPSLHLFCSVTHITILFVFTCAMIVRNQSIQAFVTCFGPFCMDRASLFTDHRISGLPIRAKYKKF